MVAVDNFIKQLGSEFGNDPLFREILSTLCSYVTGNESIPLWRFIFSLMHTMSYILSSTGVFSFIIFNCSKYIMP